MEMEAFEIRMIQKSTFPRTMPLERLLGDELLYGCFNRAHLVKGRIGQGGFVAYLPEAIGRGIRVRWVPEEEEMLIFTLPLPSTHLEIDAFRRMVLRAAREWTCSLLLNGEGITTSSLDAMEEELETINVRILRDLMNTLLRNPGEKRTLGCTMHAIEISLQEAERFYANTTSEKFAEWLHDLQKTPAYIPEAELVVDKTIRSGIYTFPSGVPVIFPVVPSLYNRSENLKDPDLWMVRLYGTVSEQTFGYLTLQEVHERLPKQKVSYYDASSVMVQALSEDELAVMLYGDHHEQRQVQGNSY